MSRLKKGLIPFFIIGFFCGMVLLGASFWRIYSDVKKICVEARSGFGGDCVSSLMALIESKETSYPKKNRAIWALGQLSDPKALPFLTAIRETAVCGKSCASDSHLCRYEVDKAIKWCSKGNATRWMYVNRENWKE